MTSVVAARDTSHVIAGSAIIATLKGLGLTGKNRLIVDEIKFRFHYDIARPPYQLEYDTYLVMLDFVRVAHIPCLSTNAAYEKMGRATVEAYFAGPAGSVIKTLMPLVGDQAAANIILKRFRELLPFGQHDVTIEYPGRVSYRKRGVGGPHEFMRGMILAMLEVVHTKNPRVTYQDVNALDVIYRIEWTV